MWDPQRAADIGAFPVIISHPIRDAAFLPVKRDQDPSINSLFHALPRGGIQKMLDAIHDNDKEDLKVTLPALCPQPLGPTGLDNKNKGRGLTRSGGRSMAWSRMTLLPSNRSSQSKPISSTCPMPLRGPPSTGFPGPTTY